MAALKLSFVIEAIDRATGSVRAVNDRIDKLTEPARKVRASFNSLVREAGLTKLADQARNVSSRFDGVTSSLRGIAAAALVVGGAAAAMWLPMKGVIDRGSQIHDTAAMLGMSAREFQRLSYAMTLDGSSAEDAAAGLRLLQKNAVEALSGSKEMQIWFRRAGMSADFLNKNLNDPAALFYRMADGMAKLPTPAQKIALMYATMGRGGARLAQTMSKGSDEIKRLGDVAERSGAVMGDKLINELDDAGDALHDMGGALSGVLNAITAGALPAIMRVTDSVTKWAVANREVIGTRIAEYVQRLTERLPELLATAGRLVAAIGAAVGVADALAQAFGGWENIFIAITAIMVGKVIVAIALLAKALGLLTITTGQFGIVLTLTPIGWFIGAVALLAGAAYLVYRNWAPISEFFGNLWEGVKGAFTDAFEFIAGKVNAVMEFVTGAILKLDSITPNWVKKWTLPGAALSMAANSVRPSAAPSALGPAGASQADVGGTIKIEIDQDGRARVAGMKSNNPAVDFDVDAGQMFVGA